MLSLSSLWRLDSPAFASQFIFYWTIFSVWPKFHLVVARRHELHTNQWWWGNNRCFTINYDPFLCIFSECLKLAFHARKNVFGKTIVCLYKRSMCVQATRFSANIRKHRSIYELFFISFFDIRHNLHFMMYAFIHQNNVSTKRVNFNVV